MPSLFLFLGYRVFFWSREEGEPIHVHICKGNPSANTTKVWILQHGGCLVANNDSGIPERDLEKLLRVIDGQRFMICDKWKRHLQIEKIKYFA